MPINPHRRPSGGFKPAHLVDRIGNRKRAVTRDSIVVEKHGQLVKIEMSGKGDRFLAYPLHEVAVGCEHVGTMIHHLRTKHGGEMPFRNRHADSVAEALPERPGRRLHARSDEALRMSGSERAELSEASQLVDAHFLIT